MENYMFMHLRMALDYLRVYIHTYTHIPTYIDRHIQTLSLNDVHFIKYDT
jgi:hypothetical protein